MDKNSLKVREKIQKNKIEKRRFENSSAPNSPASTIKRKKDYLKWDFNEVVDRFDFIENIQKESVPYKKRKKFEIQRDEKALNERRVEIFKTDRLPSELLERLDDELPPPLPRSLTKSESLKPFTNFSLKSGPVNESIIRKNSAQIKLTNQFTDKLNTFIKSVDCMYDLDILNNKACQKK